MVADEGSRSGRLARNPGAAEVVVAVLDTGVDRGHPDLQGALVEGWDAVNEDADAEDDHGHGTLVAGVIAARSNNGIGGVGACSQCSLMPVKVIGATGSGTAADIAEGIVWGGGPRCRRDQPQFRHDQARQRGRGRARARSPEGRPGRGRGGQQG